MPTEAPRSTLPLKSIGHYDILQKIADGGMGSVYRGRDQQNGGTVAIKIVPPHMANNDVLLKRFRQEFDTATIFAAIILIIAFVHCMDRYVLGPLQASVSRHYAG